MRRVLSVLGVVAVAMTCATGAAVPAGPAGQAAPVAAVGLAEQALTAERTVAGPVGETRMVDTVRRLVAFGPRQYGTPSNHEAAAWLASEFRKAGLEVSVREDPPRNWYQPASWQGRAVVDGTRPSDVTLETTWPSAGAPSVKGEGVLAVETTPGAVCLTSWATTS